MAFKKMLTVRKLILLGLVTSLLAGCSSLDNFNFLRKNKEPEKPKISYYPYLTKDQFLFLNRQNILGIFPGYIITPEHEDSSLEYQMNATSWWGLWPNEIVYLNYFFAEQAKRKFGCGPIKAGAIFTIKKNIYAYKGKKISVAYPISWQAKVDMPSICQTASYLSMEYFKNESIYWDIPFSQNRIYP